MILNLVCIKLDGERFYNNLKFDNVAMSSCQINSLQVVDSAWLEGIFSGSLSHHSRNHHLRVLDEASGQLSKL